MTTAPQPLFQASYLDIFLDSEVPCLHLDWKGQQTDASIRAGCERLLELMAEHQVYKILNDNTNAVGVWTSVVQWLVFDMRPRAFKAGMTCCAHVFGPSRLSQLSAEAALLLINPFTDEIKPFNDVDDAKLWLKTVC